MIISRVSSHCLNQLFEIEKTNEGTSWSLQGLQECLLGPYEVWGLKYDNSSINQTPFFAYAILKIVQEEAELVHFCVHASKRQQGLGKYLLTYLIKDLKQAQIKHLFLEVACDNEAAIALYEKLGAQPIGLRRNYYWRSEGSVDALCMCFSLLS
jgi:[ribosomal protein S18]-alanine N-acetyltransferase